MYDLIYGGKEVEDIIRNKYPEAKITDASDDIHTERFECEVDVPEDEFYIFALRQGFADCCFSFNLMMRNYPEGSSQKVWDWIAEAKVLEESAQLVTIISVITEVIHDQKNYEVVAKAIATT